MADATARPEAHAQEEDEHEEKENERDRDGENVARLGLGEVVELAAALVGLVANVAIEHAVTHETATHAVALRLLAQKVLRVDAVLAAGALELVRRALVLDHAHGRPRELEARLDLADLL